MNSVKEKLEELKVKQKKAEKHLRKFSHYWSIAAAAGIAIGILVLKLQMYYMLPLLGLNYWQIYRGLKRYLRNVKRYDDICDEINMVQRFVSRDMKLDSEK
ncbi:hypothetical protein [Bacillus toyonensis]|uniref:hypothetical protein n=1 Tax=Bacillus toyonensis TaxID=155322 RepID=UPI002E1A63BC|nr:hypothetical protein [Bacillus toyonensis]